MKDFEISFFFKTRINFGAGKPKLRWFEQNEALFVQLHYIKMSQFPSSPRSTFRYSRLWHSSM